MALTERQKEIKALQQQGKKAPEIAEALGITTNAVYQQLRRMKGGASKPAASKASTRKPAATKKPAAAKAAPVARAAAPAKPLTPEKALKVERDAIAADLKVTAVELESARKALAAAEAAHVAALDGKRERVVQIDAAITALTGEAPEPLKGFEPEAEPTPEPTPPTDAAPAAVPAAEPQTQAEATAAAPEATATPQRTSNGTAKAKPAAAKKAAAKTKPAAAKTAAKPAAATPEPKTQAEREASADFTDDAAAQAKSGEPEPVAA